MVRSDLAQIGDVTVSNPCSRCRRLAPATTEKW